MLDFVSVLHHFGKLHIQRQYKQETASLTSSGPCQRVIHKNMDSQELLLLNLEYSGRAMLRSL